MILDKSMKLLNVPAIEPLLVNEMDAFMAYVNDQLAENGAHGVGYFQPMSRESPVVPPEKVKAFITGLGTPVSAPGWRRGWVARLRDGQVIGHLDLRARPEPFTSHRCLLGMGVHRDYRRAGLGMCLLEFGTRWATESALEWMDLEVISGNSPAHRLYRKAGFLQAGDMEDLFRIDGQSVSSMTMVKRLVRPSAARAG